MKNFEKTKKAITRFGERQHLKIVKILFLTPNLSEGYGIVAYNKNLLNVLKEGGVEVRVVELQKGNIFWRVVFSLRSFIKLIFFRPDVIFCTHVNFSPLAYFLGKVFVRKYIVFTYGVDIWDVKGKIRKLAVKNAHTAVSISHYTAGKLTEQILEIEKKIFILPPAVDGGVFSPKEKRADLVSRHNLSGKKVIFTLGRLSAREGYKGYDKVIQALPRIIEKVSTAVYMLAGSGDDIGRVEGLIKKLGLKDNVVLPGFIPDKELVDYYNLCDVFVMPSKQEGFGIVFLEALACGKPVIAGNKDGSRDPLLDGNLGILINPDDIDEIADAIVRTIKKETSSQLLDSNFLRENVLNAYGFDKFKRRVDDLLNKLQT